MKLQKHRIVSLFALVQGLCLLNSVNAQDEAAPTPPPAQMQDDSGNAQTPRERGGSDRNGQDRNRRDREGRNFNPQEMRTRMVTAMREQMGVSDEQEWKLIADRIEKVQELRMGSMMGMGMGMGRAFGGGAGGGGNSSRPRSSNSAGSAEMEALQAAIKADAPAAEIKARLTKLRAVRSENEAKLAKAQEDLRAVLNVKQEAVAVMFGLLQ